MRLPGLILLASLSLVTNAESATPWIELRWNSCNGSNGVEPYTPTDHVLFVVLNGAEGDYNGIQCTIGVDRRCNYWPGASAIPDAWRFDNAGCQAGLLRITRPTGDGGCPGLGATTTLDAVTLGTQKECWYAPDNPCGDIPALLIQLVSLFPLRHLSATERYVVAKITIPMGETVATADPNGVLCGCGSIPVKIEPISAQLASDRGENPFGGIFTSWVDWGGCVTAPQPTSGLNSDFCAPVAAQRQSWGAVKAFYR